MVENFISVEVFLKRPAAPRLQMVSVQLTDAHQVQKVLRQQPWLVGRCKTSTPSVSYTRIRIVRALDKEKSPLLWRAYKFCVGRAANSCKSTEPILHQECPHIQSRSFLTDNFKNLKSIGVP
jgi:hypothetical protein